MVSKTNEQTFMEPPSGIYRGKQWADADAEEQRTARGIAKGLGSLLILVLALLALVVVLGATPHEQSGKGTALLEGGLLESQKLMKAAFRQG